MRGSKLIVNSEQKRGMQTDLLVNEANSNHQNKFEHLLNNLKRIDPKYSIFHRSKDLTNVFSLNNGNIEGWLDSLLPNTRLIIEPKIEGCSIALNFEGGTLKSAIDRKGSDKTSYIKLIRNLPKKIPIRKSIHIHGQIYHSACLPLDSKRIVKEFLQGKSSLEDEICFCGFHILNSDLNEYRSLQELSRLGFEVPETEFTNYTNNVFLYSKICYLDKTFFNYPSKGIVLKVNSRKLQKLLGESHLGPRWAYAIEHR